MRAADFLTLDEKRAAVGYGPVEGGGTSGWLQYSNEGSPPLPSGERVGGEGVLS